MPPFKILRGPALSSPRRLILPFILAATSSLGASVALAASIGFNVDCNGSRAGSVSMRANGGNLAGSFKAATTLADAVEICKVDHFDWYQIVTSDNGRHMDSQGNALKAPYVDPPPGGYNDLWADNLPWYYNEYAAPKDAKNVNDGSYLTAQTTDTRVKFFDAPTSTGDLAFKTWLVGVNADGSFAGWDGGFSWSWENGGNGVSKLAALGAGENPTDAEYKKIIGGFASSVPEPGAFSISGLGLVALAQVRKRATCKP